MNWLEPFRHTFMLEAFGVGAFIALVCAIFSCFLVLRGWSLMGDAISHAVLPGIVIAYVAGLPLAAGAFASGLVCAGATGFISRNSRIKEDTAMGVVFTGLFALGLVLFTKVESDLHLNHILFGHLLGIERDQIAQVVLLGLPTLAVIAALRKDLMLYCFDQSHARTIGLNVGFLHYLLLALLALVIVTSLQAVGIILVIAMLIFPGCTALLVTKNFGTMTAAAVLSSLAAAVIGIYGSFILNASTSASIVLAQAAFFILALSRRLLLHRRFSRRFKDAAAVSARNPA